MFRISVIFLDMQTEGVPGFPYFSHTMPAYRWRQTSLSKTLILTAIPSYNMMLYELYSINSVLKFFNKYRQKLNRNRKPLANTDIYIYIYLTIRSGICCDRHKVTFVI